MRMQWFWQLTWILLANGLSRSQDNGHLKLTNIGESESKQCRGCENLYTYTKSGKVYAMGNFPAENASVHVNGERRYQTYL